MILYDTTHKMSFIEFGIQIPIFDSKASHTFALLKNHSVLGPRLSEWHCGWIQETITEADLLRAHSRAYVERLFSDALEDEIVATYELIDAHGRYYRYDPKAATEPLSGLFDRIQQRVAGTTQCGRIALEKGFCFYFGGGHAPRPTRFRKRFLPAERCGDRPAQTPVRRPDSDSLGHRCRRPQG